MSCTLMAHQSNEKGQFVITQLRPPARGLTSVDSAWAVAVLATVLIGALALNRQSLWIDELGTWRLTRADNLSAWLAQLLSWPNSDAQLPLYHAWIKLWTSAVPQHEWMLRASNLPWLALAFFAFWRAPVRRDAIPLMQLAGLVCALHPLTWYYVNELRPYAMLLAATAMSGVGLTSVWMESEDPATARLGRHFLLLGLAMLAACSPIGVIWIVAFAPAALWLSRNRGRAFGFEKGHGIAVAIYVVVLIPIFAQYLMSFLSGASAAAIDNKVINFLFAFYELIGLGGIGPGREELRGNVSGAVQEHAPALAVGATLLLTSIWLGLRALWRKEGGRAVVVLCASVLPVFLLFGLAEIKHWRVVGRHLLPLLFFVCLVLAAALRSAWLQRGSAVTRALTGAALGALLVSSLDIRWADRHQREMYSAAAQAAAQTLAGNATVWWFADDTGPEFYGLGKHAQKMVSARDYEKGLSRLFDGMQGRVVTDCRTVTSKTLLAFENPTATMLSGCPAPARVIYSRREAFDQKAVGAAWLQSHGFHLQQRFVGFEVWE